MDPDACLDELRTVAANAIAYTDDDYDLITALNRMAELVEALDGWISKGGFLPTRWQHQ